MKKIILLKSFLLYLDNCLTFFTLITTIVQFDKLIINKLLIT